MKISRVPCGAGVHFACDCIADQIPRMVRLQEIARAVIDGFGPVCEVPCEHWSCDISRRCAAELERG